MSRTPSEREAIDAILADFRTEIHTYFPARVVAYNATKQTVDVTPGVMREYPSDDERQPLKVEKMPDVIYNVPIQWPRAGGFAITFPIAAGDWVGIECAEQALHNWRAKADVHSHPGVSDPHGLNGCLARPGCFPDKQKLSSVDASNMVIRSEDNGVRIVISGTTITLGDTSGAQFVALSNKVDAEIARIWSLFSAWVTVPNDGGAALKTLSATTPYAAAVQSTAATMVKAK